MRHFVLGVALFAAATSVALAANATVPLAETKASGESGSATMADSAKGLVVTIALNGGGADAQPAHIHKGKSCDFFDPKPTYPLTNIVNGKSTTTLKGVKLAQVQTGEYVINVHKSTKDLGVYVACGAIAQK